MRRKVQTIRKHHHSKKISFPAAEEKGSHAIAII
jgi:hypothetical protein